MDSLFAHGLGLHGQWQGATGASAPAWAPALDIAERKDAYLVTVELPGVRHDDLEITLEDGLLTIQGVRQFTSESSEEHIPGCRTRSREDCAVAATVLVADDDADILRFVEIYLRMEGFEVVTACDGPDVLAKAVAVRPDLVLLDVLMPGLDGYAVCAQIRADATLAAVPVIMVTANYVSADVAAARRVGADDFLVKPFDPVVLLDKAKALLS